MLKSIRFLLGVVALSVFSFNAVAELVKQSSAGICHNERSSSYSRTKNFTAYSSLEACLATGGRLPKNASSASHNTANDYSRQQFGSGWADENGDCRNSRAEALIAQSLSQVAFRDDNHCQVDSGRWLSPYSGDHIYRAKDIDIDHVVPLRFSWDYGSQLWTKEKRIAFANDPANLLSVEASLNRQKGAKGLSEWLPPKNQCQYIVRFLRVSKQYGLHYPAEKNRRHQHLKHQYCR